MNESKKSSKVGRKKKAILEMPKDEEKVLSAWSYEIIGWPLSPEEKNQQEIDNYKHTKQSKTVRADIRENMYFRWLLSVADPKSPNGTRLAVTTSDFSEILEREFARKKYSESQRPYFIETLIDSIENHYKLYFDPTGDNNEPDYLLMIETSRNLVSFLKDRTKELPEDKPVKPFIDYLDHYDKPKLMAILRSLIAGEKGRRVAAAVRALKELQLIDIPERGQKSLHRAMSTEFGEIGSYEGFEKYMSDQKTDYSLRDEIDRITDKLDY
jgi:hypothetical protein